MDRAFRRRSAVAGLVATLGIAASLALPCSSYAGEAVEPSDVSGAETPAGQAASASVSIESVDLWFTDTGERFGEAADDAGVTVAVVFSGAVPGARYALDIELVDAIDGAPLTDSQGAPLRFDCGFEAEASAGVRTSNLSFCAPLPGRSVAVVAMLAQDGAGTVVLRSCSDLGAGGVGSDTRGVVTFIEPEPKADQAADEPSGCGVDGIDRSDADEVEMGDEDSLDGGVGADDTVQAERTGAARTDGPSDGAVQEIDPLDGGTGEREGTNGDDAADEGVDGIVGERSNQTGDEDPCEGADDTGRTGGEEADDINTERDGDDAADGADGDLPAGGLFDADGSDVDDPRPGGIDPGIEGQGEGAADISAYGGVTEGEGASGEPYEGEDGVGTDGVATDRSGAGASTADGVAEQPSQVKTDSAGISEDDGTAGPAGHLEGDGSPTGEAPEVADASIDGADDDPAPSPVGEEPAHGTETIPLPPVTPDGGDATIASAIAGQGVEARGDGVATVEAVGPAEDSSHEQEAATAAVAMSEVPGEQTTSVAAAGSVASAAPRAESGLLFNEVDGLAFVAGLAEGVDPSSIENLFIPSELGGLTVARIEAGAFTACTGLQTVILPSSASAGADPAFPEGTVLISADLGFETRVAGAAAIREEDAALDAALVKTNNVGDYRYAYSRWATPTNSYLHEGPDGSFERVEYVGGRLIVEVLSEDYLKALSATVVPAGTYRPSDLASEDNFLWGGFFSGSSYNFVVTGQTNYGESDSLTVYRVTRYSKAWDYEACYELKGANTYIPFDAGSCRMTEVYGRLYVRTCHKMYQSSDGLHHQANVTLVVDESSMSLVDGFWTVYNVAGSKYGYVSHSFNQFIDTLDGEVFGVDHGDAYPRSVVMKLLGRTSSGSDGRNVVDLLSISGGTGDNDTGVTVGGMETSSARSTILVAGSSIDQSLFNSVSSPNSLAQNVWLSVTPSKSFDSTRIVWLTSYPSDGRVTTTVPYLVKVDEDRFLVIWGVDDSTGGSFGVTSVAYVFVDGNGYSLSQVRTVEGRLSDCAPAMHDGKAVWYVGGAWGEASTPAFYQIDGYSGAYSYKQPIDAATIGFAYDPSFSTTSLYDSKGYWSGYRYSTMYTGLVKKPQVTASFGDDTLVKGKDFEVSYQNNVDAGTATVVVTGMGNYAGTAKIKFDILPQQLSNATLSVKNATYTGKAVKPATTVKLDGKTLKAGGDYTVKYAKNTNASSSASVTVTGKGNYAGSVSKTFTIKRASIAKATAVAPARTYNGSKLAPALTVKLGGKTLKSGTDYSFTLGDPVKAGTYTVTVTGKGNYTGTLKVKYKIARRSLAKASIALPATKYSFTGSARKPATTVKVSGKTLVRGTDYTVAYKANVLPGTATVTVTGKGNYTGKLTKKFTIKTPAARGWFKSGGKWYCINSAGKVLTGWQKISGKRYYLNSNGAMQTGWAKLSGKWYFFGASGAMRTGWTKVSGKWYYMASTGVMQKGWIKSGGKWYLLGADGAMRTGWAKSGGKWYYLTSTGAMKTGWVKSNGVWYYLTPTGAMKTGWLKSGGKWYYLNRSGAMQTGWLTTGGKQHYFDSSGVMLTGTHVINGYWYHFDEQDGYRTNW